MDKVVRLKKLSHYDESFPLPEYKTLEAAGADLRASFPSKSPLKLLPGEKALIRCMLLWQLMQPCMLPQSEHNLREYRFQLSDEPLRQFGWWLPFPELAVAQASPAAPAVRGVRA